jgi:hypothetical protein
MSCNRNFPHFPRVEPQQRTNLGTCKVTLSSCRELQTHLFSSSCPKLTPVTLPVLMFTTSSRQGPLFLQMLYNQQVYFVSLRKAYLALFQNRECVVWCPHLWLFSYPHASRAIQITGPRRCKRSSIQLHQRTYRRHPRGRTCAPLHTSARHARSRRRGYKGFSR